MTNILIRKLDDQGSYEILENYKKSFDIPKIPTSAYSSKTFSSLFLNDTMAKMEQNGSLCMCIMAVTHWGTILQNTYSIKLWLV